MWQNLAPGGTGSVVNGAAAVQRAVVDWTFVGGHRSGWRRRWPGSIGIGMSPVEPDWPCINTAYSPPDFSKHECTGSGFLPNQRARISNCSSHDPAVGTGLAISAACK